MFQTFQKSQTEHKQDTDLDVEEGRSDRTPSEASHCRSLVNGNQAKSASTESGGRKGAVLQEVASKATARSGQDPGPPPDGGLKAWLQVAMGFLVLFTTWGWLNSFGAFQTYYTSTLTESPSTISWIGSIQVWLTFFISACSGRLLDAGLFLPTLFVGSVLQLVGIFLMSLSTQYWHLMLTQGVLTGLGGGIIFCPSIGLIATYFQDNRALAIGLTTLGNSVGGMIYPLIVRELLPEIGFPWTARVLGFVNLACLCLAMCFMRPRLPPRKSGPIVDWKAFKEPVFVLYASGLFFAMSSLYFTLYYIASFGVEAVGMSYSDSAVLVILINGAGIPGRIIPPLLADRTGQLNITGPVVLAFAVCSFAWLAVSNAAGYYAFTSIYGLLGASFQCLISSTAASLTPDLNMVGTRLGMAFSIMSFGALTGPPIGGALQNADGGRFTGAQLWAAVYALIAGVLILGARICKVGWRLSAKC